MFGFGFGYWGEDRAPWGEAAISKRAEGRLEQAKALCHNHIASVDCGAGPVSCAAAAAAPPPLACAVAAAPLPLACATAAAAAACHRHRLHSFC